MELIVSKSDLESLKKGWTNTLRFYDESELHHEFGDYPDQYVTKINICDTDKIKELEEVIQYLGEYEDRKNEGLV